ncbi:kinectin-like isoform X1 [Periplaneta americana]|uniref:kinectin-like isoform X1 n=1 Tax=Periplaneta americana TaxID=6978 RepID=UPI0037E7AA41
MSEQKESMTTGDETVTAESENDQESPPRTNCQTISEQKESMTTEDETVTAESEKDQSPPEDFSSKHELQDCNKNGFNINKVKNALTQIRDEYRAAALQLQRNSEKLITEDDLSENAKCTLDETAGCLQELQANDESSTSLILQYTRMMVEKSRLSRKRNKFQRHMLDVTTFKQRIIDLRRDIQSLQRELQDFKEPMERKVAETQLLQHRMDKYKKTLEMLKDELQKLGVSENHHLIKERMEAYTAMESECSSIRNDLEKYEGLPPNLVQAQEVLAQTKQKLENVKQQLNTKLERTFGALSGLQQP